MKLSQKQIDFTLDIFSGLPQAQAYSNHYISKSRAVADAAASKLLRTDKIQSYLKELRQKTEDSKVASVIERKQILSEITRGRLTDYTTCGPDRDLISVGSESPNTAALQEITTRTEVDEKSAGVAVITKLKLHNPIQAIDLLNKMDKIYTDGSTVNVDNRTLIVAGDLTDEQLARIASGKD